MVLNAKKFEEFVVRRNLTFAQYIEKMENNNAWGGHYELVALSIVLNKRICIINESKDTTIIDASDNENSSTIYLAHDRTQMHYSSLRKIEQIQDKKETLEKNKTKLKRNFQQIQKNTLEEFKQKEKE